MDARPTDIAKLPSHCVMVAQGFFADGRELRRAARGPGGIVVISGYPWKNARTAVPAWRWVHTRPAGTAEEECHADV